MGGPDGGGWVLSRILEDLLVRVHAFDIAIAVLAFLVELKVGLVDLGVHLLVGLCVRLTAILKTPCQPPKTPLKPMPALNPPPQAPFPLAGFRHPPRRPGAEFLGL